MSTAAPETDDTGAVSARRDPPGLGRALVVIPRAAPSAGWMSGLGRSHGIVAAGVAVVMGAGFVAGTQVFASKPRAPAAAVAADTTLDVLVRVQGEMRSLKASLDGLRTSADEARQVDTIRSLKRSVDLLKQDVEAVKTASAGAVGQLGAKLDKLDRDPGPKLAEIAARLDKLDRDPDAKLAQMAAQLTARFDRMERQVASADATGAIPPQGPASPPPKPVAVPAGHPVVAVPSGATPPSVAAVPPTRPEAANKPDAARAELPKSDANKPEAAKSEGLPGPRLTEAATRPDPVVRPAVVQGWLLRDVYGGVALVEGRFGGLREIAPGEVVPGAGEVRSIERRGRNWVVVTSRGVIQADSRW